MMKNILEQFLNEIEVHYTTIYADKLYNEHPHRNNMFGLKMMLDVYGVKTLGVRIEDKNLSSLTYPCILHTHGDFAIGRSIDANTITYLLQGKKTTLAHDVFKQTWTGNALVIEETTEASEPAYVQHQKEERWTKIKKYCVPFILAFVSVVGVMNQLGSITWHQVSSWILSMLGVYVCCLLIQKQLYGESRYGDCVCSLFHHADCNDILDGPKSKIYGIKWSEIGMGYFTARVLLLSLYPEASLAIILINWIAMLYGIWSIHYQWKVAKSWCVLCVIVQTIIWIMGLLDIVTFCSITFSIACVSSIFACLTYTVSIIVIHHYVKAQAVEKDRTLAVQQYRALKANEWVAKALFENRQYYETSLADSSIVFGDSNAKMRVTILSNPHCNPCARMHLEVERLLDSCGDSICVQYIFSSFNESLDDSSRYLISCYDAAQQGTTRKIYSEWYAGGKGNYEKLIKQHSATIHTERVEKELLKHEDWRKKTGLVATPTVLVNGYELPNEYNLGDLAMLTDCVIETKKNILQDINGRSTTPLGAEQQSAEETV